LGLTPDRVRIPGALKRIRQGESTLRSTNFVHTAIDTRAHKGYRGTRPTFTNVGHNVLYRWTDVLKLLAHNTFHRTDDPR